MLCAAPVKADSGTPVSVRACSCVVSSAPSGVVCSCGVGVRVSPAVAKLTVSRAEGEQAGLEPKAATHLHQELAFVRRNTRFRCSCDRDTLHGSSAQLRLAA